MIFHRFELIARDDREVGLDDQAIFPSSRHPFSAISKEERESKGERGSYEEEFLRDFTKVTPSKDLSSSSLIIILNFLEVLKRSNSASNQGSLPASGGKKGVGFSSCFWRKQKELGSLPHLGW
ncbi:hypothetical protein MA16_Dca016919 [Dendrobium catenatum]|uniref:Uncharacterized protein n=1 Tax=Dendrobium catenatum TaxID=906689 RepID=A0A2I0XI78_9ASPA|nr:hypothetical protein MA16_Dca016919 [Dendrobium catenatum]